jgi:hypothetical protein
MEIMNMFLYKSGTKKTWFAFQNLSSSESKILNFSNIVHDPKESQNEDLNFFSYKWKI